MTSGESDRHLWGRFDDLRAGTALLFADVRRELVAWQAADVGPVLQDVQRTTDAGQWAFGYVAYEAASGLDPALAVHPTTTEAMPLVWFGVCDEPVGVRPLHAADPARAYSAHWCPAWTPDEHRRDVARIHARIERGDTYQCNLTVRMRGRFTGDPLGLYRDLALGQRGAHNAYLGLGRFAVASASPELFFQRIDDDILLRPMKGTAARGRTVAEDHHQERTLRTSAKERAENVMIVDLIRNDVAQVAETGSVRVRSLCRTERYPSVFQLTSDVHAKLRSGSGLYELFRVLFPSGSVTGAPKASTMALIRELEPGPRGVYCGVIGFVGPRYAPVRARFNVAIRTAVVDRATSSAVYGVGGGITWSSEAVAEHAEVLAKAIILDCRHRDFELMETMRYVPGRGLRNRRRHLARLAESAAYFEFRFDLPSVLRVLAAALIGSGPVRVRLRLSRDGHTVVDLFDMPSTAGLVVLAVDHEPVDSTTAWLYHKTSLRDPYERRLRRHPGADEVVLLNENGELTETTRANLALRLGERWWTPPVSSGCLPGVERARLLDLGRLSERVLHEAELYRAEKVAVLNSLRGWRAAVLSGREGERGHSRPPVVA